MTYSDEKLPYGETLVRKDPQLFIKRLRKRYPSNNIRTFYCGEYGGETRRPHYHALIFGLGPTDKEKHTIKNGRVLWRSDKIDEIWGMGHCNFGQVSFQSAQYVAGYITKKIGGEKAKEHYQWIDETSGRIIDRLPEFQGQSLKPGIGYDWIEKWIEDVYPRDIVIVDGQKTRPPKYYDKVCERIRPDLWRETRKRRMAELPKYETKEWYDQFSAGISEKKGDPYVGTSRQRYAKARITQSRQRTRDL